MSEGIFQADNHTFDYEHRLTGVGNRLQVTRYVYDASGNLLAETDGAGTVQRYYIHGHDRPEPGGPLHGINLESLGS